jgi:hypothetical protein
MSSLMIDATISGGSLVDVSYYSDTGCASMIFDGPVSSDAMCYGDSAQTTSHTSFLAFTISVRLLFIHLETSSPVGWSVGAAERAGGKIGSSSGERSKL